MPFLSQLFLNFSQVNMVKLLLKIIVNLYLQLKKKSVTDYVFFQVVRQIG